MKENEHWPFVQKFRRPSIYTLLMGPPPRPLASSHCVMVSIPPAKPVRSSLAAPRILPDVWHLLEVRETTRSVSQMCQVCIIQIAWRVVEGILEIAVRSVLTDCEGSTAVRTVPRPSKA